MNGCMVKFPAAAVVLAILGAGLAAPAGAQPVLTPPRAGPPNPATEQAIAAARQSAAYPTFASIPPLPTDVRPLASWKSAVMTVRDDGAALTEMAAAEPWTLSDTDGWAGRERAEAAPPPPVTTASSQADSEAYAAALRARAIPPPRKR
jgi:hypothetical protein